MPGLTSALAEFISNSRTLAVPERAAEIIRTGFIDTIATMIAGRNEPVVEIVRRYAMSRSAASGEASLLGGLARASRSDAALINGTAGHALDFDDVALGGHPSTVLVPAILAEAEANGQSGTQAIRAYLAGYEVWAELNRREPHAYHLKGWHPTAVLGTLGATAAVAALRGCPVATTRRALALAASFAGGMVANFGTMTKPLHAGRAARAGIEAVDLAEAGLSASDDALEHPAGFLAALSPNGKADRTSPSPALGQSLAILETGLSIKKYPICYATHRVIDAVIDLTETHALQADQVEEARVWIGPAQVSMLRNHAPVTGLEAKFSMEFAIASSVVERRVGLRELTDEFVNRPAVRSLMSRVRIEVADGAACPYEPVFSLHDRVQLRLRNGKTLDSGPVRFARGNALLPLSPEALRAKFVDCAASADDIDAAGLFARLTDLAAVTHMGRLFS
ncbi:MAG: MmgE/PrpD family protein [Betaproteobacteria bacterium]